MPLSVGLVEGLERCGDWATKVCCGSAKFAVGIEASAKCGGWATEVCCESEKHGEGWSERFVGW